MTIRKHLKFLVRERIRKTGERYTVARRHIVGADTSWELRGGVHGDTAVLTNVLANLGVVAPHTGEPLTEAMMLGVGGGLGAGYILWEFDSHPARTRVLTLGFRRLWQYPDRWAREATERLGLHCDMHETGSVRAAAAALDGHLERGLPAIVWADSYTLGHRGEPQWLDGYGGAPLIVYERCGDAYAIDDLATRRVLVPAARLTAARARVGSYKHRLITIDPERIELDLQPAVEEGLRLQVQHLNAPSDSFSLPAWRKWARMTTDKGNKKGWPTVFADGLGVGSLRASIYAETAHGAHLRALYADFLTEAAGLLGRESLIEAASAWRHAASCWEPIVDAALPLGDDLRVAIDSGDPVRWTIQRERDQTAGVVPEVGELVAEMHRAETSALGLLGSILAE